MEFVEQLGDTFMALMGSNLFVYGFLIPVMGYIMLGMQDEGDQNASDETREPAQEKASVVVGCTTGILQRLRYILVTGPTDLLLRFQPMLPDRLRTLIKNAYVEVFERRHSGMVYVYVMIMAVSLLFFWFKVLPHSSNTAVNVLLLWLYVYTNVTYVGSVTQDPGIITADNVRDMIRATASFYDGKMFVKGQSCGTCKFEKPARSKHCRLCDQCVSTFDHHCVWINSCVGQGNMTVFTAFLVMVCALLWTACAILTLVMRDRGRANGYADLGSLLVDSRAMLATMPELMVALAAYGSLTIGLTLFTGRHVYNNYILGATFNERWKQSRMALVF
eukprot:Clim_evm3s201 gene=Clim_evmTU3s201